MAVARELGIELTYVVSRGVNLPYIAPMKIRRFEARDRNEHWLEEQLKIFSRPLYGFLYSRLKPER